MRVCVVGAGALGGYYGGRLLAAGRDVTFLVRPARAERLAASGLQVKSRFGDLAIAQPPTLLATAIEEPFDLVVLGCKAYDLDDAIRSVAPAVGPATTILPLLNGMAHLDRLDARFGQDRVIGGLCQIGATLDPEGRILHLNDIHTLTYGERDGSRTQRVEAIEKLMADAGFAPRLSEAIVLEMWEKWAFLASLAAATASTRAQVGDILAAPGGRELMLETSDEARAVAAACGFPPRDAALARIRAALTQEGSTSAASMARDIGNGARIEADHVIGDLIRRGREHAIALPRFETAYTQLKAYEAQRDRVAASSSADTPKTSVA